MVVITVGGFFGDLGRDMDGFGSVGIPIEFGWNVGTFEQFGGTERVFERGLSNLVWYVPVYFCSGGN